VGEGINLSVISRAIIEHINLRIANTQLLSVGYNLSNKKDRASVGIKYVKNIYSYLSSQFQFLCLENKGLS